MKKPFNPFLVRGYQGPDYFCDREEETKQIISAIKNGRNLNIYNIRRIGKTALIHHSLSYFKSNYVPIFIDIEKTETQSDLTRLLIEAISKKVDELDQNLIRKLMQWVSKLGATLGIDENTGLPTVEISSQNRINDKSLEETFQLTTLIPDQKFVIAIDEFQQILSYPETNTEAIFRSITQQHPNIGFIFSGSSRRLMEQIFAEVKAPFYQSTENIKLGYIDEKKYLAFAKTYLPECADELIIMLIKWCRYHTYYVQYTLNVLYELKQSNYEASIFLIKERVLKAHEFYYFSIRKLVTNDQWKILKAIAQNSPVQKPTSSDFSQKTGIAQSTIKYNLDQLVEKDLVLREEDGYKIYNVFFGHLLAITKS
jgi:uncharacterized protein